MCRPCSSIAAAFNCEEEGRKERRGKGGRGRRGAMRLGLGRPSLLPMLQVAAAGGDAGAGAVRRVRGAAGWWTRGAVGLALLVLLCLGAGVGPVSGAWGRSLHGRAAPKKPGKEAIRWRHIPDDGKEWGEFDGAPSNDWEREAYIQTFDAEMAERIKRGEVKGGGGSWRACSPDSPSFW